MILVIDSCVSDNSSTRKFYEAYLKHLNLNADILYLKDLNIRPLNNEDIKKRNLLLENKKYDDKMFDLANNFVKYDKIIVAAPFWDLSFPSILKVYFENISVVGITFGYEGIRSVGYAKADEFIYFATAGGYIDKNHQGYLYTKELFKMFGINNSKSYIIDSLDIDISKKEEILNNKINKFMQSLD